MSKIELFQQQYPSDESYWRSIILFGANVASYKFALSKSLLEIIPIGNTNISLDDLAEPFSRYICEHIATAPKQGTSVRSRFLDSCRDFNQGLISKDALLETTIRLGFNNVIDAFHVVNQDVIPKTFFEKDYSNGRKKIILTDDIFRLQEMPFFDNLMRETESRWKLVETAWDLGISRNLLSIDYDNDLNSLFVTNNAVRRKNVTSARDALNGYQKGKCFYCNADISLAEKGDVFCEVDHFFPHMLQPHLMRINLNGVWNLVLACQECNRSKSARVPEVQYLQKLHSRNEYLITSHHPLRETIILQTGLIESRRSEFIKAIDKAAINHLIQRWGTTLKGETIT